MKGSFAIGDLDTDSRMMLKCVLSNWFKKIRTGLMWLGVGTSGAILKYSNEVSGSIKSREFLVYGGTTMSLLRTLRHGNWYWKQFFSLLSQPHVFCLWFFFVQFKERLCRITEYILLFNDALLVFTLCSIMGLFWSFRVVCYLHLESDWIWFGWMLQHSPEPPENLCIIFLYLIPDFGRNLITVRDFERKERKKERKKIYVLLFIISPFL